MEQYLSPFAHFFGPFWPLVWTLVKILVIVVPLMGIVAYTTLAERKVIGWMQQRVGPNRVGPLGLLQPVADGFKVLFKEIIRPSKASFGLYFLGPVLAFATALTAWAVVPFGDGLVLADIDAGLLFVMAVSSFGVYGVIIAGWASNSKYAFLAAMRSAAQMASYELAMGFGLVCVLMVSGSLNLSQIVAGQAEGWFAERGLNFLSWNWLPLLPMCLVYFISGVAECNRAPFDVVEGESEIVAGHMVEYSGMAFSLFFLAEYTNMALVAVLTAIFFFGGWLSPVAKAAFLLFTFLWIRATFPRFRYDQIMRLGWKVFIPLALFWVLLIGAWIMSPWSIWK